MEESTHAEIKNQIEKKGTIKQLTGLTSYVRKTKGSGEALRFYVNYVQPIYEYFGIIK